MKNHQRTYTILAVLLVVLALLLPIGGTMVVGNVFSLGDVTDSIENENPWSAFFAAVSVSMIMLNTLFVTCLLSCVLAGVAIRLASAAINSAHEEKKATILPRIVKIAAIAEVVIAALGVLFPLVLLIGLLTL